MLRRAFKMKLLAGNEVEYEKRHNEIWPELGALLKESGISKYSIFLDKETLVLFGYMQLVEDNKANVLAEQMIMQKWWKYMRDIMESNEDDSPVAVDLQEVFYMD